MQACSSSGSLTLSVSNEDFTQAGDRGSSNKISSSSSRAVAVAEQSSSSRAA